MRKKRMRYWSRDRPKTRDTKQRHPKHPDPNTKSKFKLMEVPVMKQDRGAPGLDSLCSSSGVKLKVYSHAHTPRKKLVAEAFLE